MTTAHRARTNQSRSHTGSKTASPAHSASCLLLMASRDFQDLQEPPFFRFFFFRSFALRSNNATTDYSVSFVWRATRLQLGMQYEALMLHRWDLFFASVGSCFFFVCWRSLAYYRIQNVENRRSCVQILFHFHPYPSQRIRWGRWPCNEGGKSQKPPSASAQLSGQNSRAAFLVRCCEWTAGAAGFRPTFLFWAVGAGEPRGFDFEQGLGLPCLRRRGPTAYRLVFATL